MLLECGDVILNCNWEVINEFILGKWFRLGEIKDDDTAKDVKQFTPNILPFKLLWVNVTVVEPDGITAYPALILRLPAIAVGLPITVYCPTIDVGVFTTLVAQDDVAFEKPRVVRSPPTIVVEPLKLVEPVIINEPDIVIS